MAARRTVFVSGVFEALHQYKDAPSAVEFLRYPHRHLFHVKVWFTVSDPNRQIEFFLAKEQLSSILTKLFSPFYRVPCEYSCEHMAEKIIDSFVELEWPVCACEVSEDGENGALVGI